MLDNYRSDLSLDYNQDEMELIMLKRLQTQLEGRIKRHYLQSEEYTQSDEGLQSAAINNDNKLLYARLIKSIEEGATAKCEALVRQILRDEQEDLSPLAMVKG